MKILLLGEYSNVHWTLAQGLRTLGHQVVVLSNGDFWKDYPRDINLVRQTGKIGGIRYLLKLYQLLPKLRGYDIVQLINPMFLELKAERIFHIFSYLKRNNKQIVLGAFGMDYYWVHVNTTMKPMRYSDFNIGQNPRTNIEAITEQRDWIGTTKQQLNETISKECHAIVAGLYEYYVCYQPLFPAKTNFIPFPIEIKKHENPLKSKANNGKTNFLIGINGTRSAYKGTDIMLNAAKKIVEKYPQTATLKVVESVPFAQYQAMLQHADVLLDQLYSYTPAMNALEAMSRGTVCVGGGEPENYEILNEKKLKPIINVEPTYESVYQALEKLALHPEEIATLQTQSMQYIERHHDHIKVAKQYENLYIDLLKKA